MAWSMCVSHFDESTESAAMSLLPLLFAPERPLPNPKMAPSLQVLHVAPVKRHSAHDVPIIILTTDEGQTMLL
eukprot:52222-Eustigmatos_ZCMA.PRE.1